MLFAIILTWAIMKAAGAVRAEHAQARGRHAAALARQHPDWTERRVARHARQRAVSDWLSEVMHGLPRLRAALAEDWLLARTVREEALAGGATRRRQLRERLDAALAAREAERQAAREAAGTAVPEEPEDGTAGTGTGNAAPEAVPDAPALDPPSSGTGGTPGSGTPPRAAPAPPWHGGPPAREYELHAVPDTQDTADEAGDGDDMPDIISSDPEGGETPYEGMQAAFGTYADAAATIARQAGDDLSAQAAIHGFDRDPQILADLQELEDLAAALVARAQSARTGLISRHEAGAEYHTGQDANASAFRPA